MKPLVYVAGPYTVPDPVVNVRRACVVADALVATGAAVFVPHLSMLWHLVSPAEVDEWYQRDLDVLNHCHALVRFYGQSDGADREWVRAGQLGLERWTLGEGYDDFLPGDLLGWIAAFRSAALVPERAAVTDDTKEG